MLETAYGAEQHQTNVSSSAEREDRRGDTVAKWRRLQKANGTRNLNAGQKYRQTLLSIDLVNMMKHIFI
eukprot:3247098-Prorocentrum_lima.AAC.1